MSRLKDHIAATRQSAAADAYRKLELGVVMRDGVTLAVDVYLPPAEHLPVPALITPHTGYDKAQLSNTDGEDTDWHVRLWDVQPDGRAYVVAETRMRASYRQRFSHVRAQPESVWQIPRPGGNARRQKYRVPGTDESLAPGFTNGAGVIFTGGVVVSEVTVLAVGDIILGDPDPARFFAPSSATLHSGDAVIAHVETPYTREGIQMPVDVPSSAGDPERLKALPAAGFNLATIAGNHAYDQGLPGVRDTIATLRSLGLETAGTGLTLAEARQPAFLERQGMRFGLLSYNAVGPRASWAGPAKAGAAYVDVMTHYEQEYATPGGPGRIYTFVEPDSLEAMEHDVEALRPQCDIAIVGFHKGVGHTHAEIASAEKQLTHAAVNAGADIVVGHHAHICKGIEVYRGKPIYHGLGNFVTPSEQLSDDPRKNNSPERLAWAKRRKKLFGFEPDPSMPNYLFHPESRNTLIARVVVSKQGVVRAGFIPCYIDQQVRPVPVTRDTGGQPVVDYLAGITAEVGLKTAFAWSEDGAEVLVS